MHSLTFIWLQYCTNATNTFSSYHLSLCMYSFVSKPILYIYYRLSYIRMNHIYIYIYATNIEKTLFEDYNVFFSKK